MKLYILINEDDHYEPDVSVFDNKMMALRVASKLARDKAYEPSDYNVHAITHSMAQDRWLFFATYSPETGSVRVVERELNTISEES